MVVVHIAISYLHSGGIFPPDRDGLKGGVVTVREQPFPFKNFRGLAIGKVTRLLFCGRRNFLKPVRVARPSSGPVHEAGFAEWICDSKTLP